MDTISQSFAVALAMVAHLDPRLTEIVRLSLAVSLSSTACSAIIGLPVGAALAIGRFPGREPLIVALNAAMGLPPVVVVQCDEVEDGSGEVPNDVTFLMGNVAGHGQSF